MARLYKVTTSTATLGISAADPVLFTVNNRGNTDFLGMVATNGLNTATYYVKFYWTGQTNLSYAQMSNIVISAACTVVPQLTVQVPAGGLYEPTNHWPVGGQGQLYFWAVSSAADGTNSSLAVGGDTITVFYD